MKSRKKPHASTGTEPLSTRVDARTGASISSRRRVRRGAPTGAGNHLTAEEYERARVAYLAEGTVTSAARAAGVSTVAAQRLLDSGVPILGLPPLRDAARVEAARVEAQLRKREAKAADLEAKELAAKMEQRAKAAKRAREHETKVLGDAERSRAEEVKLVRMNRISATVLAQTNADLLRASSNIARSLVDLEASKLSVRDRLATLRTIAGIVHRTAQASAASVQMERLLMGEPTAILGRVDSSPSTEDMTPEEAEQWLELANRAFRRRAARSTVVEATAVAEDEEEVIQELVEDLT